MRSKTRSAIVPVVALTCVSLGAPAPAASSVSTTKTAKPICGAGKVVVPAGTFAVGTTALQAFLTEEQPRRVVRLTRPFCLDRTEVTVADYARCVSADRCAATKPAFSADEMPMTNVSWREARDACVFRGGRLPTEVEWEHAARGVDDRLYPWGDWHPRCEYADSMYEMWGHCNGYGPSAVGSFPPGASPYGALDMAGNVLEWVDDAWDADAWKHVDPIDPRNKDDRARHHVVRGGSWEYDVVHSLRVSQRDGYPTELRDPTLGFRCAYDVQ